MSSSINLFTIGFTQKKAQDFFELLIKSGVKTVIDTRLNNNSQLAGFSKRDDLQYFLKTIGNIDYIHLVDSAPTKDILDDYKKKRINWETYTEKYLDLITKRRVESNISPELINNSCLLCSEAKPHHCHRRLLAEYLQQKLTNINLKICHL
jgi:uncharacterized protein (DUF488 family)